MANRESISCHFLSYCEALSHLKSDILSLPLKMCSLQGTYVITKLSPLEQLHQLLVNYGADSVEVKCYFRLHQVVTRSFTLCCLLSDWVEFICMFILYIYTYFFDDCYYDCNQLFVLFCLRCFGIVIWVTGTLCSPEKLLLQNPFGWWIGDDT